MSIAAAVTTRSRLALAGVASLSAAARIAVVVTALRVGAADSRGAVILGVVSGALLLVQRALAAHARVFVESDLRRAAVRSILAADVVDEPKTPFDQPVYESSSHALHYLTDVVPELGSSIVAFVVILPMLVGHLAGRFVMMAGAALLTLAGGFVLVRSAAVRAQRALGVEYNALYERLGDVMGGRLDIVASGQRGAFERGFEGALTRLARVAARTGPLLSFLGRVPLALGAAVLGLIVLVDPDARQAFQSTILAQAVLLAAAAPVVLGIPLRAQEVVRARVRIAPLLELLARPPRSERTGGVVPRLPAPITARSIEFAYDSTPVVSDLSFDWHPGHVLILEGPNGSGKSTLLRLLVGLRPISGGSITVADESLHQIDLEALRARIAYLPQRPYFGESNASVASALRFPERTYTDDAMKEALVRVGLPADMLERRVWSLSGGQRQRIAIARMLLVDAPIWLLDEPDASLDAKGMNMLVALVREQVEAGRMIAIAAHTDLAELEGVRVSLRAR